jgi:hypothetical protein
MIATVAIQIKFRVLSDVISESTKFWLDSKIYRRLLTLLITLLPINIAIQIAMLVIILRSSPNNLYHNTIVYITIISDQLQSL